MGGAGTSDDPTGEVQVLLRQLRHCSGTRSSAAGLAWGTWPSGRGGGSGGDEGWCPGRPGGAYRAAVWRRWRRAPGEPATGSGCPAAQTSPAHPRRPTSACARAGFFFIFFFACVRIWLHYLRALLRACRWGLERHARRTRWLVFRLSACFWNISAQNSLQMNLMTSNGSPNRGRSAVILSSRRHAQIRPCGPAPRPTGARALCSVPGSGHSPVDHLPPHAHADRLKRRRRRGATLGAPAHADHLLRQQLQTHARALPPTAARDWRHPPRAHRTAAGGAAYPGSRPRPRPYGQTEEFVFSPLHSRNLEDGHYTPVLVLLLSRAGTQRFVRGRAVHRGGS